MSSALPPANNMIMLGVLGIGAYWFLTHRAVAGGYSTPAQLPVGPDAYRAQTAAAAGSLVGQALRLFGIRDNNGTVDGRSATQWDVTPTGADGPRFNNPSAYVSSAVDGMAFNPPTQSAWDAAAYSVPDGGDTYYGAGQNWGV